MARPARPRRAHAGGPGPPGLAQVVTSHHSDASGRPGPGCADADAPRARLTQTPTAGAAPAVPEHAGAKGSAPDRISREFLGLPGVCPDYRRYAISARRRAPYRNGWSALGDALPRPRRCAHLVGDRRRGATILPVTRRNLRCMAPDVRYPPLRSPVRSAWLNNTAAPEASIWSCCLPASRGPARFQ
jgi:hypothetical protein